MNCRDVKKLILTDYLDAEAPESVRAQVKAHLDACSACAAFERTVREKVSLPFRALAPEQPPEALWQRIRESVAADSQAGPVPGDEQFAPSFSARLRDFLAEAFGIRKPALAFATALSLILLTVLVFQPARRERALVRDYLKEQRMFLAAADQPFNGAMGDDFSLGTAIEKYLF